MAADHLSQHRPARSSVVGPNADRDGRRPPQSAPACQKFRRRAQCRPRWPPTTSVNALPPCAGLRISKMVAQVPRYLPSTHYRRAPGCGYQRWWLKFLATSRQRTTAVRRVGPVEGRLRPRSSGAPMAFDWDHLSVRWRVGYARDRRALQWHLIGTISASGGGSVTPARSSDCIGPTGHGRLDRLVNGVVSDGRPTVLARRATADSIGWSTASCLTVVRLYWPDGDRFRCPTNRPHTGVITPAPGPKLPIASDARRTGRTPGSSPRRRAPSCRSLPMPDEQVARDTRQTGVKCQEGTFPGVRNPKMARDTRQTGVKCQEGTFPGVRNPKMARDTRQTGGLVLPPVWGAAGKCFGDGRPTVRPSLVLPPVWGAAGKCFGDGRPTVRPSLVLPPVWGGRAD